MGEIIIPKKHADGVKTLRDKKVLVTGGCGFLGRNLCSLLLQNDIKVKAFDLNPIRFAESPHIEFVRGDIVNESDVDAALDGCSIVIHTASPSPLSNNPESFERINVGGMKCLLRCAEKNKVEKIIYVSSASVAFDGTDQYNMNEEQTKHITPFSLYAKSKLDAEKILLNYASDNIAVCAIRPHSIFGPFDANFIPNLAKSAFEGKYRYYLGSGMNLVDFTYVGNVSYALLLASIRLNTDSVLNRNAYFITNREILNFWDTVGKIYQHWGFSRPYIQLPENVLFFVSGMLNSVKTVFPSYSPTLTEDKIIYSVRHHYYSCEKAVRDFDYEPLVPFEEGLRITLEHFDKIYKLRKAKKHRASFALIGLVVLIGVGMWMRY